MVSWRRCIGLCGAVLVGGSVFAFGCGSTGSSTDSGGAGSALNDVWDPAAITCSGSVTGGTFSDSSGATVTVTSGTMSVCVNATATPTFTAVTSLPSGLDLHTTVGETNVTASATAYTFDIKGDRGFETTASSAVAIALPFDPTTIPVANRTSLKVFVRIFNADDNSLVDLAGSISGSTVTVETRGLPKQFTAIVIYNSNMAATAVSATNANSSESVAPSKNVTSKSPWPARRWCAIYNEKSSGLITAVQTKDNITGTPTGVQLASAVKNYVAQVAVDSAGVYETAGFRAPNLVISQSASDPCGDTLGTNKRYNAHVVTDGNKFVSDDTTEAITPEGNHYGRLYVSEEAIAWTKATNGATITNVVAHEMLHAIQNGYELKGLTTKGYREGTATTYGTTMQDGSLVVRSLSVLEIWRLSDFVTAHARAGTTIAYANQDFFAYVGRKYNNGGLAYLAGLFEQLHTDIEAEATALSDASAAENMRWQPLRAVVLKATDTYVQSAFTGSTLKSVYLDFMRQRAFDHNTESKFGRTGETTSGFASDLFVTSSTDATLNSIAAVSVNASDCTVTDASGTFGNVAPLATRIIRVTTGKAASSTTLPKVTVTITPKSGTIGTEWDGYTLRSSSMQGLSTTNTFTSFGQTTTDEIDVAVANTGLEKKLSVSYTVTCEGADSDGSGGSGGYTSTFRLDTFTLSGEGTWIPAYLFIMPDFGSAGVIDGALYSDAMRSWTLKNLQIQFGTGKITGPGTYTIIGDDPFKGPAALLYSPGTDAATADTTRKVFTSAAGTVTLTAWGTNQGDHITGTVTATMVNDDAPPKQKTGTIGATFDFVIGSFHGL